MECLWRPHGHEGVHGPPLAMERWNYELRGARTRDLNLNVRLVAVVRIGHRDCTHSRVQRVVFSGRLGLAGCETRGTYSNPLATCLQRNPLKALAAASPVDLWGELARVMVTAHGRRGESDLVAHWLVQVRTGGSG